MSFIKPLKFILPLIFILFIINTSYSELNQQSHVNSSTEIQKVVKDVKELINIADYEKAIEKLQISKRSFKSMGNMCDALAVDTWTAKIYAYKTDYQQAISLLKNTKYGLEQHNCSTEYLAFKDIDKMIIGLNNNLEGVNFYVQNKTHAAISSLQKARDTYRELREDGLAVLLTGEIGVYYLYAKDYEVAISYFQEALQVGESMDDALVKMLALGSIGCCHGFMGNHEKAENFFDSSLGQIRKINMTSYAKIYIDLLSRLINEVANSAEARSRYMTALKYHDYALKFNNLTDNLIVRAATKVLMGMIHEKLYQFDKSLEFYQKALLISDNLNNLWLKEQVLTSFASVYQKTGQYEKAIDYFNQSLEINKKTKDLTSKKAIIGGLGWCNFDLNRKAEAIDYFTTRLDLCEKTDDRTCQLSTLDNLSICYEALGDLNKAIKLKQNIIKISHNVPDQKMIAQALLGLSSLYRKSEDESSAVDYWLQAFRFYLEMEDRQAIIDNIFLSSEKDYFHQKKYIDMQNYLNEQRSSAEKNNNLKKQIFTTILLGDLNYYYYIDEHDDLEQALKYYKAANQLNKKLQDPKLQTYILYNIAYWYFYVKNDSETSLNCMNELLNLAEQTKDVTLKLSVLESIADGYRAMGRIPDAIKYNLQGLKIAQDAGEEKSQRHFYSALGAIDFILGNYQKAIDYRMKALNINWEIGDAETAFLELHAIAWSYFYLNQLERSMSYANDALNGYIRQKNNDGVFNCLTLLMWASSEMGNNYFAQQFLSTAVKIIPYLKDYDALNEFYIIAGLVKMRLGDYKTALYSLALSLYSEQIKKRENLNLKAEAYGAIGLTYVAMGDYDKAEDYVEKSLEFFIKGSFRWGEALALNQLGLIHGAMKKYNEAFVNLSKSEKIFHEIGNIKGHIQSLIVKNFVLGKQLIEKKRRGESVGSTKNILTDLQRALELSKKIEDKNSEAAILLMLGIYYFENTEYEKAQRLLRDAEAIAVQNYLPEVLVAINHQFGKVFEGREQYIDALSYYQKAIVGIETLQSGFGTSFLKGKFLEKRREPYEGQFKLLVNLYQRNADNNYKQLAFTAGEKAKARSLLDSLNRVQAAKPSGEEKFFTPIKDIENKLGEKQNALRSEKESSAQEAILKKDLAVLQDELALFKTLQQRQDPTQPVAKNLSTPNIQYQDIQSLLDEKTIFVEYVCSEDKSHAWLITKDKFEIYDLSIAPQKLEELVKNYRATLRKPQLSTIDLSNHIRLGQGLFKILLSPIENEILAGKKLIVIPDGPLYYLPFETLIIPKASKADISQKDMQGIPYLITKTPISYFHSGAVMASMMKKSRTKQKNENKEYEIVAFGDPIYSRKEESKKTEIDRSSFYETRGVNFERLTYSSQEVENIAKIFNLNPASECINLREKATEKRVYDLDLKNYKRIHFATHGILADEITWINQPSLVLSQTGTDEKYDGFLTMDEIYGLNLNADLIVLSACKTGLGEEIKGEGLVGLTHAFIHAGTDSLVVSLWDVNDQSTSLLMESFYNHLKTMNKADALRNAKLDLINGKFTTSAKRGVGGITQGEITKPTCSHPYYWAPFILIGKYE